MMVNQSGVRIRAFVNSFYNAIEHFSVNIVTRVKLLLGDSRAQMLFMRIERRHDNFQYQIYMRACVYIIGLSLVERTLRDY